MTPVVILTTAPSARVARRLSRTLVEEGWAACVHTFPAGSSFYRWKKRVEETREWSLMIKSTSAARTGLIRRLRALHPYDVPEILVLKNVTASPDYATWLSGAIHPPRR